MTKNKTLVEGEDSQLIGGGLEFHPASWFAVRAGAMKDIASEKFDDGMIMTAGIGFGLKSIPRDAALNLPLVTKWGDGYNKKEAPIKDEVAPEIKKDEPIKTLSPEEQERIKKESDKAQQELDKAI